MGRGWFVGAAIALAPSAPAGAAEWSPPQRVSEPGRGAWEIDVAFNERGDAVAVFGHRSSSYESFVDAAFRPAGQAWQPPGQVSDAPQYSDGGHGHSDQASVALDASGRAMVAWNHADRTRATAATAFPAPPSVNLSPDRSTHTDPWVGSDADGRFSVLWTENDRILGAGWTASGGFAATTLSGHGDSVVRARYAVGPSGAVAATWQAWLRAMVVVRRPDGSFTDPFLLNDPAAINNIGRIAPAMTPDGTVIVAWVEKEHDDEGWIRARERSPGGDWGPVRTLAGIFFTGQYDLDIAATPDGRVVVAWAGGSMAPAMRAGLSFAERSASGDWSPPAPIAAPEEFAMTGDRPPMLAVDAAGTVYSLTRRYDDNVGYTGRFWVAERPKGGSFSPPVAVSPPGIYLGHYDIAAGAGGRVMVGYLTGDWPWGLEAYVSERSGEGAVSPPADQAGSPPAPAGAPVPGTEATQVAVTPAGPRPCVNRALLRRVVRHVAARRARLRRGRPVRALPRGGCALRVSLVRGRRVLATARGTRLVPRGRLASGRATVRVRGGGRTLSARLRL